MSAARTYDAIVVGGGHNGLVCAGYLARAGLSVLALERRERPGGAAATEELAPGVRAPALAHTVGRLRASVARDLGLARHGLRVVRPAVRALALQPEGQPVALWSDPARTAGELRSSHPPDAEAWPRFDRKVRALSSFMAHVHVMTPPDIDSPTAADAVGGLKLARALRGLGGPRQAREALRVLPMAVADFVEEGLESDVLRGAVAARGVLYTSMGPRSAGTTAVLLSDSAGNDGGAAGQTAFAVGGPGALADALVAAVRENGGEVRCGAEVARVIHRGERATGVALASGEEIAARAVVSGLDPKRTLLHLVDPVVTGPTLGWRAGNIRQPGRVAKVNLALSGLPRFTGLPQDGEERLRGRILVAPGIDALERAFDASKYGRASEAPFLEATIPTLADPSLAPEGTHVMSVIAQWAPLRLRDGDWDGAGREALGDLVVKTLEAHAPGLADLVTVRQVLTPPDLERDYGLTGGHPFHAEPGLDQFFAWRPLLGLGRYRLVPRGLYLCGSGAHPGGGITGGPGANAAREILKDLRAGRR